MRLTIQWICFCLFLMSVQMITRLSGSPSCGAEACCILSVFIIILFFFSSFVSEAVGSHRAIEQ